MEWRWDLREGEDRIKDRQDRQAVCFPFSLTVETSTSTYRNLPPILYGRTPLQTKIRSTLEPLSIEHREPISLFTSCPTNNLPYHHTMTSKTNRYTPSIPSPLNPSKPESSRSPYPLPAEKRPSNVIRISSSSNGSNSSKFVILGRRPTGPSLSPTQRLMRHKAAVARRQSLALRSSSSSRDHDAIQHQDTRNGGPKNHNNEYLGLRYAGGVGGDKPPMTTTTTTMMRAPPFVDSAAGGCVTVDIEKRPCFINDEKGLLAKDGVDILRGEPLGEEAEATRAWCPRIVTVRRMVVVLGLLCAVGIWLVVHMAGHSVK